MEVGLFVAILFSHGLVMCLQATFGATSPTLHTHRMQCQLLRRPVWRTPVASGLFSSRCCALREKRPATAATPMAPKQQHVPKVHDKTALLHYTGHVQVPMHICIACSHPRSLPL